MKTLFLLCITWLSTVAATAQVDTVPPTIVCKSEPVMVFTQPIGYLSLISTAEFLDTLYDDTSADIEKGIRKACVSTGFPIPNDPVIFYQLGRFAIEVWAKDQAGNTSSCICEILVDDNNGTVEPNYTSVVHLTSQDEPIGEVTVVLEGYHCYLDSIYLLSAGNDGANNLPWISEPGTTFSITPSKSDNPLNGVSTYDLVLISKHIFGIEPLDSPEALIAADANLDGKVTTADIILLRRLILGIIQELPHGKSWRFFPKNYQFPNLFDPFNPPFPESIQVPFATDPPVISYEFYGIKIGDVNNSAF